MRQLIDAHIHIHKYTEDERQTIIDELSEHDIRGLISVSDDYESAWQTLAFARTYDSVFPAIGYHPEQKLPTDAKLEKLFTLMDKHQEDMVAIGEVGMPYYFYQKDSTLKRKPYKELLEQFIRRAKVYEKPIVLHAIYEDAPFVCQLLEKHSITQAHFHWFKGDERTIYRLIANEYLISITPDVLYEREIQQLVKGFPLRLMMVETDGPWSFAGQFRGQMTHPKMIHQVIKKIAKLKKKELGPTYNILYKNTLNFYPIKKDV